MTKTINAITAILVFFSVYMVYCTIDIFNPPVETRLIYIHVYDEADRQLYEKNLLSIAEPTKEDLTIPIPVSPRMTITGTFEVKRFYDGENQIERLIINGEREYTITNVTRQHKAGSISVVSAEYPVPISAPSGCDYRTVSKNSTAKTYNILSHMIPTRKLAPSIYFCVKR